MLRRCSFPPRIDLFVCLEVVKSSIELDKFRLAVSVKAICANGLHFILSSSSEAELFIVHEMWLWCVPLSITSMGGARMHCLLLSCVAMICDAVKVASNVRSRLTATQSQNSCS